MAQLKSGSTVNGVVIATVDTAAPAAHVGATGSAHGAATTSVAGFMAAADKSKLNGIETNATADQTAAEILTAIKTVDGTTSGLDADLLDGVHAADLTPIAHVGSGATAHALATGSVHGFLSSSDFTKLAGVESGAAAPRTKTGSGTFTSGLTHTVSDSFITAATFVSVAPVGTPAGSWSVESSAGSFTITSTLAETAVTFDWGAMK